MLLNNENVDYLSEWPAHYYEIEDINERERILQLAIEQKLDPDRIFRADDSILMTGFALQHHILKNPVSVFIQ